MTDAEIGNPSALAKQSNELAEQARSLSFQERARSGRAIGGGILLHLTNAGQGLIPPWWSAMRDVELRKFWKQSDHISGAINTFTTRVSTIPFRIEARDKTIRSHNILAGELQDQLEMAAEFGEGGGMTTFISKFMEDWITQDNGAFGEVVGPGRPDGPITGRPFTVSHLDSARCQRTGDSEFPVLYNDLDGSWYKLHWTRVIYSSQMPSPRAEMFGVGFSALSRAINSAQNLIDIAVYKQEKLGSRPTRQILLTGGGLDPDDVFNAFEVSEAEMTTRGLTRYTRTVVAGHANLESPSLEKVDLANLPDGFDEQTSTILGMATIALAFGVDARELFPAMSIGATRADALIQHMKQRGKGYGQALRVMEALLNSKMLPPTVELVFDYQDDAQDRQVAEIQGIRAENRALDIGSGATDIRTEREQMLEMGELTKAQFIELELTSGRLEDGRDILTLFKHPDYMHMLDLKNKYALAKQTKPGRFGGAFEAPVPQPTPNGNPALTKGGAGSGGFGHAGRPGVVGGSGTGGGAPTLPAGLTDAQTQSVKIWMAGGGATVEMRDGVAVVNVNGTNIYVGANGNDYLPDNAPESLFDDEKESWAETAAREGQAAADVIVNENLQGQGGPEIETLRADHQAFTTDEEADTWGEENFDKWSEELPSAERVAVKQYTKNVYYQDMNRGLRRSEGDIEAIRKTYGDETAERIELVNTALNKVTIPEPVTTYRGGRLPEGLKPGDVFVDHGFVSTSMSIQLANAWKGSLFEIHIPAGTHGAFLSSVMGTAVLAEAELLLNSGTQFKYVGTTDRGITVLEVIP